MTDPTNKKDDGEEDRRDAFDKALDRVSGGFSRIFSSASEGIRSKPESAEIFFRAVRQDKAEIVGKMIDEGIDPDAFDRNGDTALALAVRNNALRALRVLIEKKTDPRKQTREKRLPIEEAVNYGRAEAAALLARNGGYVPGLLADGRSLLHRAAEKGRTDIVRAFLEAGADGNETTENGSTPLIVAVQLRQAPVAEALLDSDDVVTGMNHLFARTDTLCRSAFLLAVERGMAGTVRKMLERGAFPNHRDAQGATPLQYAIAQGNPGMVRILAAGGADLNRDDFPLFFACASADISATTRGEIISALIGSGADPDRVHPEKKITPLHAAILAADGREALKALLKHGASTEARDDDGATPVFYSVHKTSTEVLRLLLDAGADPNARRNDMRTPLIQAVHERSPAAVRLLLERGADPALAETGGKTALSYAREYAQQEIADLLEAAAKKAAPEGANKKTNPPFKEWRF